MLAVLFPGQGSEQPGMGSDLCARSPAARALVERASRATGIDLLRELGRFGPSLRRTEVLQPALVAVCLGIWAELEALGVRPDWFAGHSLGEICAWTAAGGLDPDNAVDLAARRGVLMADAASREPGGMLAIHCEDERELANAVDVGRTAGSIEIAAHNAPHEWVLSGQEAALRAVAAVAVTTRLPVSGPWHSDSMRAVPVVLHDALAALPGRALAHGLVMNATGEAAHDDASARAAILEGLVRPVRWVASLRALAAAGVTRFIVVGPGRALRASVRLTLGHDARVWLADDFGSIERTAREIRRPVTLQGP